MVKASNAGGLSLAIAALLFVGIFVAYVSPIKEWRFWGDDYSAAYYGSTSFSGGFLRFFTTCTHGYSDLPSNAKEQKDFFGTTLRPVVGFLYSIQMSLFGFKRPYAIFLVTIFLLAFSGALFFYILSLLVPLYLAVAGGLFFAFHPALGADFGQMNMQPLYMSFLLLAVSILSLRKWYLSGQTFYLGMSAFFSLILLFLYELFVALPVFFSIAAFVAFYSAAKGVDWRRFVTCVIPQITVLGVYLVIRLLVYPPNLGASFSRLRPWDIKDIFVRKFVFLDIIPSITDLLGLSWISSGCPILKAFFILSISFLIALCFFYTSRKKLMFTLLLGSLLMYWPPLIGFHNAYFVYLPSAFLIAAVLVGASKHFYLRIAVLAWFLVFAGIGFFMNRELLRSRAQRRALSSGALEKLVTENKNVRDKPILFVGVPNELFDRCGLAAGVWLYRGSDSVPVYVDSCLHTRSFSSPTVYDALNIPNQNLIDVSVSGRTIRLTSNDKTHVWFGGGIGTRSGVGDRVPHNQEMVGWDMRTYDVSITVDEKWWSDSLVLVRWNFKKCCLETI